MSWALTKWRSQVLHLAKNTMRKSTRGAALGWVWIFVKPAMYIFCFWFALDLGLRAARISDVSNLTYIFWLSAGIIPWFFFQQILGSGANIFKKYAYLVSKLKFPVPLIPIFHFLGQMFIHLLLIGVVAIVYVVAGGVYDIHVLQFPLLIVLLYILAVGWSLMVSSLSAFSTDFLNFVKAMTTPLFWLSGILWDISKIHIGIVNKILLFNPVTFIVTGYRQIFVPDEAFKGWLWDDPVFFACGVGTILVTFVVGVFVYSRLREDIPDVI